MQFCGCTHVHIFEGRAKTDSSIYSRYVSSGSSGCCVVLTVICRGAQFRNVYILIGCILFVMVMSGKDELLVWRKDTWGSFGQHDNLYTFVIDLESLSVEPIYKLVAVRHENRDSRKNYHRFTYVKKSELSKLAGKVLKVVHDYASSSKRNVTVKYYIVRDNGELAELHAETGLRDSEGFYDEVEVDGKKLRLRKERVEVV